MGQFGYPVHASHDDLHHSRGMELQLQIIKQAGATLVRCSGRLIYGPEAAEFVCTLRQLLNTTKQIILNLACVSQIDSGGVGALGEVFMAAHNREAQIKLTALSPRVREVLRITALERLFEIHNSETEAVEAFSSSSKRLVGSESD
jgi:anti-sigma B factor antagonist